MFVGFLLAADWALVIVLNKHMLAYVNPLPLNLLLRFVTIPALLAATVPLTAFGWWGLDFRLTREAAGYIALAAVVTWVVAFNAYYYGLRAGRASVVAPITATDPIWAALFAPLVLGTSLEPLVVAGLVVATTGVVLIARWMSEQPGELPEAVGVPLAPPPPDGADASARRGGALGVVTLSTVAAAGWGLGPVIIELAENANGGASAGMMVLSQGLGALMLGGIVLARRTPFLVRPLGPDRRRLLLLLLAAGVLETVFSVFYYLIIEAIGAVLTLLLTATSPLFAILGGAVFLKERVGRRLVLAAAITIGGVVIATLARVA